MASGPGTGAPNASIDRELFQAYYLLQYERIAQYENSRMQLSNYVVAASVVALGALTIPKGIDRPTLAVITAVVALANLLTILHTNTGRHWVKVHQERARRALCAVSPELVQLQREANEASSARRQGPDGREEDSKRNDSWLRSQILVNSLHALLILGAAGILIATAVG